MSRERADAIRNRRAILRATEELLTTHRPEQISMEQVAAAAGVGKGTVFHRFGSRLGLMVALMQERALALREAVASGPPPLGPEADPRTRLLAFLDAVVEVVARNKGLLAALGHAASTTHQLDAEEQNAHPVYQFWHGHLTALLAELSQEDGLDVDMAAHALLAPVASAQVIQLIEAGRAAELAATLRALATGLLDQLR
jgi:AcrR family transcriptional regulator